MRLKPTALVTDHSTQEEIVLEAIKDYFYPALKAYKADFKSKGFIVDIDDDIAIRLVLSDNIVKIFKLDLTEVRTMLRLKPSDESEFNKLNPDGYRAYVTQVCNLPELF